MIYIGYSELTNRYYLRPQKRGDAKVDITDDIQEIIKLQASPDSYREALEKIVHACDLKANLNQLEFGIYTIARAALGEKEVEND